MGDSKQEVILFVGQTPSMMPVDACVRIVEAGAKSCAAAVPAVSAVVPTAADPQWDALANSFASLSNAFAWGSLLLAVIAIVSAGAWGWFVKGWAEKEAKKEAKECTQKFIETWLAEEAPQIVRRHVDVLRNTSLGTVDDDNAADSIGQEAG